MAEFEALWFYNPRPPGTDYCHNCLNYDEYAKIRLIPTANYGARARSDLILVSLSCFVILITMF